MFKYNLTNGTQDSSETRMPEVRLHYVCSLCSLCMSENSCQLCSVGTATSVQWILSHTKCVLCFFFCLFCFKFTTETVSPHQLQGFIFKLSQHLRSFEIPKKKQNKKKTFSLSLSVFCVRFNTRALCFYKMTFSYFGISFGVFFSFFFFYSRIQLYVYLCASVYIWVPEIRALIHQI